MGGARRFGRVGALTAMIAVLLPAGVVAVSAVDEGVPEGGGRAAAAAFAQEGMAEDGPTSRPLEQAVVTTTVAPPSTAGTMARPPAPPPTDPRSPSTTVRARGPVAGPTQTSPPVTILRPPPTVSATGRWSNSNDGVSVRMRMEPASPVVGQPVTFYIDDLIAQDPCCFVKIMFGDMTEANPVTDASCASPTTRTGMVATHTYAAPGNYRVGLFTATVPCTPPAAAVEGQPRPSPVHGVWIEACILVGPGTPDAGCRPLSGEVGS